MTERIIHQTVEVEHEGDTWVGQWASVRYPDGRESSDRWLFTSLRESDGTLRSLSDVYPHHTDSEKREAVATAVCNVRINEIREQYGLGTPKVRRVTNTVLHAPKDTPVEPAPDAMDEVEVSRLIINRAWAGEWMGQKRDSYGFYIDNLAEILHRDFFEARHIVGVLHRRNLVGLNGFILIPWREEQKVYQALEEKTGHKELSLTDFGGWTCSYCGAASFDSESEGGVSPSKVPCVKKEEDETGDFIWKVAGK